ncbi:MAG: hypothetical protein HOP19_26765 [Acidobacteria bacterium]|nr:hypothetical protein [Acidobacteriota bacterium]
MKIHQVSYEQVCDPLFLADAWIDACEQAPAEGIAHNVLLYYERFLKFNLEDLAQRLSNNRFIFALPLRLNDSHTLETAVVEFEDLIVRQALHNLFSRSLPPSLSAGSSTRRQHVEHAVARILADRANGANLLISAEITHQPETFSHLLASWFNATPLADKRLRQLVYHLIGSNHEASDAVWSAKSHSRQDSWKLVQGTTTRPLQTPTTYSLRRRSPGQEENSVWSQQVKPAIWQFGRDALMTALSTSTLAWASGTPPRQLFTKKSLAATGACLLGSAALSTVAKAVGEKVAPSNSDKKSWPNDPLISLLAELALQDFDKIMADTGFPIVRRQNQFAFAVRNGTAARPILQAVTNQLSKFGMFMDAGTTFARRFDQGVTLFGYRFHKDLIAAEPLSVMESTFPDPVLVTDTFEGFVPSLKASLQAEVNHAQLLLSQA